MQRSEIRETLGHEHSPDSIAFHPGYDFSYSFLRFREPRPVNFIYVGQQNIA